MGVRKGVLLKQITAADPEDRKSSVRAVTDGALPAYSRVSNVITASANGALPAQDGISLAVGESLLLKDGAAGADNGIYVVTQLGDGSNPFILTRRGDADATEFVNSGMRVAIEEGTAFDPGTEFVLVTPNPITLNTTALTFNTVATGGAGETAELTTVDDTWTTVFTLDASVTETLLKIGFDLQAVKATGPGAEGTALYRDVIQVKNEGGVVTTRDFPGLVLDEGVDMTTLDYRIQISGTDALFQVKGLAAEDVKWLFEATVVSQMTFAAAPP